MMQFSTAVPVVAHDVPGRTHCVARPPRLVAEPSASQVNIAVRFSTRGPLSGPLIAGKESRCGSARATRCPRGRSAPASRMVRQRSPRWARRAAREQVAVAAAAVFAHCCPHPPRRGRTPDSAPPSRAASDRSAGGGTGLTPPLSTDRTGGPAPRRAVRAAPGGWPIGLLHGRGGSGTISRRASAIGAPRSDTSDALTLPVARSTCTRGRH